MAKQLIYFIVEILKRQRAPAFLAERSMLLSARKKRSFIDGK